MVPGGFATTATEIQQEGLRLPPVKLVRRGEMVSRTSSTSILNNIRVPEERIGDIRAQVGALTVGERRLTALLDRYGAETVEAAIGELKARLRAADARLHRERPGRDLQLLPAIIDSDGIVERAARDRARHDGARLRHRISTSRARARPAAAR